MEVHNFQTGRVAFMLIVTANGKLESGGSGWSVSSYLFISTTCAGLPRTNEFGATLSNTTLPAETMAPEPISTPGAMKLAAAIQLPLRTVIGATSSLKSSRRKSWLPVQRYARWLMQTLDSMVTGASVRMPTSSPIQTWSPIANRHGNEMFTFARITTPRPIFAPNKRNSVQRRGDGHGNAF